MGILDRVYSFMGFFGLVDRQAQILILGLNNAGKSTLLMRIAHNLPEGLQSTRRTSKELVVRNVRFVTISLNSQQGQRLWSDHFHDLAGIFFLIDAADYKRFAEAKAELDALLAIKEIQATPIVVMGNKIDDLYAVSEEELRYELGFEGIHGRPIKLCMCSLVLRNGYGEALRWLANHI
ncbi:GTP-binding protein-like protein [Xylaria scruposa]|nr:GTP-binding protein-like protein [Xylaria scruposa]